MLKHVRRHLKAVGKEKRVAMDSLLLYGGKLAVKALWRRQRSHFLLIMHMGVILQWWRRWRWKRRPNVIWVHVLWIGEVGVGKVDSLVHHHHRVIVEEFFAHITLVLLPGSPQRHCLLLLFICVAILSVFLSL